MKLKEFTVTKDGETLIQQTLFQDLTEFVVETCDYIKCTGCHIPEPKNLQSSPISMIGLLKNANIPNTEFDSDSEVEVVEKEKSGRKFKRTTFLQ